MYIKKIIKIHIDFVGLLSKSKQCLHARNQDFFQGEEGNWELDQITKILEGGAWLRVQKLISDNVNVEKKSLNCIWNIPGGPDPLRPPEIRAWYLDSIHMEKAWMNLSLDFLLVKPIDIFL